MEWGCDEVNGFSFKLIFVASFVSSWWKLVAIKPICAAENFSKFEQIYGS